GDTTYRYTPQQVGTGTDWVTVAAGSGHSLAVKRDGTLWSWGYNFSGELGLGDTTDRNTPQQVGTGSDWASVAAGSYSEHSLAIKTDGTLWAWGHNGDGQLGLGDTTFRYTPQQVGTGTNWVRVAAGGYHTLGIRA
uniref:RCC1 domain-containing protein n=1 Tax=Rhabdothermincola sp. TaxID=2820405 RepID=UPI003FA75F2E